MATATRQRWETSATVAITTDWFSTDIIGRANAAVKHTLQIMVPTTTIVNIQLKFNAITKVIALNGGTALPAVSLHKESLIIYPGMSYNIQHAATTQNVACSIVESENVDI